MQLASAQTVVEQMVREGRSFRDVEAYVERATLADDQKAALWLLAWWSRSQARSGGWRRRRWRSSAADAVRFRRRPGRSPLRRELGGLGLTPRGSPGRVAPYPSIRPREDSPPA